MFFALPRVALGLCADLLASTLAAQGCGLRADMQLLNTVPGGTGWDLRLGTGWLSSCPLVLPGDNAQSSPQGCSLSGSCTSIADYGTLRTFGSGNAVSSRDVDLTATFDITPLTPGVALQLCSGATYNGLAARVTPVGVGCGAAPPVLSASAPTLGGIVALSLTEAPANAPVVRGFALGGAIGVPHGNCVLQLDPGTMVLDLLGLASATGQQQSTLAIPSTVDLLNFRLTAQALPLVANGPFLGAGELSIGVELQVGS